MDAELKRKWVEALRSGKYAQARSTLYDQTSESFCCIGVLCVLMGFRPNREIGGRCFHGVHDWPTQGGMSMDQGHELADLNDNGKSFSEIADYIEENL